MKKLILLIIFVISTSYIAPEELEYSAERREIQENIDEANANLNQISLVISDENRLKQIKDKIKKERNGSKK